MTKAVLFAALASMGVLCGPPAGACPGPSQEKYLVWFGLPDLAAGEVAFELDMRDFAENRAMRSAIHPEYKIKSVLVGALDGDRIRVQPFGSSCSREAAAGTAGRLVLVGRLHAVAGEQPVLIPRYMAYDHPFRVEAARGVQQARP